MKQLLQDLNSGQTMIIDAPEPEKTDGHLLINTTVSLISTGTERMLADFSRGTYFSKARQQPEKLKMVLEKAKTDGLMSTIDAIRSKLAQPIALGYSNVGIVIDIGKDISGFKPGDRVISNGHHADVVLVPKNLCARIPDTVDDESSAFAVIASIGLQGIRIAQPTLGESIAVIGVGLIGLLIVQMLNAHGCRVLAIDIDERKLSIARQFGSETCNPAKGEDPVAAGMNFSKGRGVDGVIISASTKSNEPVIHAARMSRKRGRIVLVGVTGLELNRADFYEKELCFHVSCSYGPGRYDPEYEYKGNDYPFGYVRWTEQRNFEAALDLMAQGKLNVSQLITHRFAFEDAAKAYTTLSNDPNVLGILLKYKSQTEMRNVRQLSLSDSFKKFNAQKPVVSFIGAGNYASRVLIPAFKAAGAQFHTIVTSSGTNGAVHGQKAGFVLASTDIESMLANDAINTVAIATRHDTHSRLITKALAAGKHVFVEKPLALTHEDLSRVKQAYYAAQESGNKPQLMVGFNRRFAPHVKKIKSLLERLHEPMTFVMIMNAGAIPPDHWTQDQEVGGGRIIGEACHYIDLIRFLAGSEIVSIQARCMGNAPGMEITEDKAAILLGFANGSFGTIHYLANGSRTFPKERVEIFAGGRVLQLDNFRKLRGYGWPDFKKMHLWRQDKGQKACPEAFLAAIEKGEPCPIPVLEIFEVARITIEIAELLRQQ